MLQECQTKTNDCIIFIHFHHRCRCFPSFEFSSPTVKHYTGPIPRNQIGSIQFPTSQSKIVRLLALGCHDFLAVSRTDGGRVTQLHVSKPVEWHLARGCMYFFCALFLSLPVRQGNPQYKSNRCDIFVDLPHCFHVFLEVDQGLLQSWHLCSHRTTRRLFSTAVLAPRMHVLFATFTKISAVYVSSGNNVLNASDSMKTLLHRPVLAGFMESSRI